MVEIDPDVYGWDDEIGSSNESIVLSGPFAEADGIAALQRVASRFLRVDDRGAEHTEEELYGAVLVDEDGEDLYTPNHVSDPRPVDGGLHLDVDCKGGIEPPMAKRLRLVLQEELAGLGDGARVHVFRS